MISLRLMSAVVIPATLFISGCGGESSTKPSTPSAITPETTISEPAATATAAVTPAAQTGTGLGKPEYTTAKRAYSDVLSPDGLQVAQWFQRH